jgi:hypothetical protein
MTCPLPADKKLEKESARALTLPWMDDRRGTISICCAASQWVSLVTSLASRSLLFLLFLPTLTVEEESEEDDTSPAA